MGFTDVILLLLISFLMGDINSVAVGKPVPHTASMLAVEQPTPQLRAEDAADSLLTSAQYQSLLLAIDDKKVSRSSAAIGAETIRISKGVFDGTKESVASQAATTKAYDLSGTPVAPSRCNFPAESNAIVINSTFAAGDQGLTY